MNEVINTLQEIYHEIKTFSEIHKLDKKPYNLFKVLEVEEKEVLMCRVLTDLLNPEGLHGQGEKYLKSFLNIIFDEEDSEGICSTAHVYKEYPITKDKRIDIVIASADRFIPIEVKINAGEQKSQCFDYFNFAKHHDSNIKLVYLTKWGYEPSDYSLSSANGKEILSLENVKCISFAKDILGWLADMIQTEEDSCMAEMLRQYKGAIEEFTLFINEDLQMEVAEKIAESEEHFRSMLVIQQAANKAKALLITKVMAEIEKQMISVAKKYGLKKETRFEWYEYPENATERYYLQSASTYPGINYVVEHAILPSDIELWFRVEVDDVLFSGFCLFDPNAISEEGKGNQLDNPSKKIEQALAEYMNLEEATFDAWWVQWWYLPTGKEEYRLDRDHIPNFKDMNEAAVRLSNEEYRKEFVSKIISVIDSKIGSLLIEW